MQLDTQTILAMITVRDAIDTLLYAITVENQRQQEEQEESSEDEGCRHENKDHFGTLGCNEHWKCRDCGFEFRR